MPALKKLVLGTITAALLCIGSATVAMADTTNFDFETLGTTSGGSLTSVVLSQAGLTMTLSRPGSTFDISNIGVGAYGSRTLDPFANFLSATVFNANFSQALSSISIDMGDFTPSDDDNLTLVAYDSLDGTGSVVGTATAACCGSTTSGFVFSTLTVTGAGIRSVRFIGGSSAFPNSIYYDNIRATFNSVPEPATMMLLGTGLVGVAAKLSRRRKARNSQLS